MDDLYGPPLPPGFVLSNCVEDSATVSNKQSASSKFIGPQCPPFITQKCDDDISISSSNVEDTRTSSIIGPEIPFQSVEHNNSDDDDGDDDDICGPLPPRQTEEAVNDVVNSIEKRAVNMKIKLEDKGAPAVEKMEREEWMIIPDTSRRNQLGAISRCLAPSAKSSKKGKHSHWHSERDKKTEKELKKYNKSKRSESLLEMHQKDKKKKKKSSEPQERKAFDRDEIAVRHFSKDQVNSVIDKAKYLNSRFAPGNKHYL